MSFSYTMSIQYKIENGQMIISGDTYPEREWIKAAGGKWLQEARVWRIPVEKVTEEVCAKFRVCCIECTVYSWGKKMMTSCKKHAVDGVSFRVNGRLYTGD